MVSGGVSSGASSVRGGGVWFDSACWWLHRRGDKATAIYMIRTAVSQLVLTITHGVIIIPVLRLTPIERDDPTQRAERPPEDTPQEHPPTTSLLNPGDKLGHQPRMPFLFLVLSWRHRQCVLPHFLYFGNLITTSWQSFERGNKNKTTCGACFCVCVCVEFSS